MAANNPVEAAAREYCARLLKSQVARLLPPDLAEGLVIVAFTLGAAWVLDRPDMLELANAQLDSARAAETGALS